MTQAVAHLLEEAEQLSVAERAELADLIVESLAFDVPCDVAQAHLTEVRHRIAQVENGEVELISGPEALAQVRSLLSATRGGN
jgi:hypothetical protein